MPHKRAKKSVREAETAKKGSNLTPSAAAHNPEYDDTPRSASRVLNSWKVQSAFRSSGRVNSEDTGERRPRAGASSSTSAGGGKPDAKSKIKDGSTNTNTKMSDAKGKGKDKIPSILPHESLGEYNRRIEDLLRPGVSKAIQTAASVRAAEEAQARREKKERKKRTRIEKLVKDGKMPKEALEKLDREIKDGKRKRAGEESEDEDGDGDGGDAGADGRAGSNKHEREAKTFAPLPGPRRLNDIVQAPPQLPHLRRSSTPKSAGKGAYAAVGDGGRNPLNAGQRRILEEERERVVQLYREMKAAREDKAKEAAAAAKVPVKKARKGKEVRAE